MSDERLKHMLESHPLGLTGAVEALLRQERERHGAPSTRLSGGFVVALQYWRGDETAAMELARLIADLIPTPRQDVTLALCRRFDQPTTTLSWETAVYCGRKLPVLQLRSPREGLGHPAGCNELWAGSFHILSELRARGDLTFHSAFFCEADGNPLSADWLDRLIAEHAQTLRVGKRVTGPIETSPERHVNGSLMAHLSLWEDRPSLHRCPPKQAWDIFHGQVLLAEARQDTTIIRNEYGSVRWSEAALNSVARNSAWICNVKDGSARAYAKKLAQKTFEESVRAAWLVGSVE